MSRLPDTGESIRTRLARQASHDVLRTRHQRRMPQPMNVSKSTRITPSRSRMSDSSVEDMETPSSVPRFSISSSTSTQTSLTTPRSSVPSLNEPAGSLWIGQRVSVDSMRLVGTLRFLGTTQFKAGVWAGIELDHPGSGKNDGAVDGMRYFACPPKTGIFVLASKVTCRTQRKKKTLAKQTSLPCINVQQRPRHPLSVSPHTSGIPSPEMTPTAPNIDTPVMHQEDKFHLDTILDSSPQKKETDPAPCLHCKDLETKLAEMTAALTSNTDITMSYKGRVVQLEQTVDELKRAGMETIELYEGAIQKHEQDMKRHTAKIAGAHARIQALENERDRLTTAKEDAETVLAEYTQQERPELIAEHEREQKKSAVKIQELKERLERQQNAADEMKAQLEQQQQSKDDFANLQTELNRERTTHECVERENHRLLEKVATLEGQLRTEKSLDMETQQLKQDKQSLQEALKQSQSEYQLLRDRVKVLPPTPAGLASIPEQQLQAQLNEARSTMERMRQERALESEKHRRQVNTLNRDIAQLESLIEAKIFKEADLLEALDNERRVVQRLLAEHQGSIAGNRRRMTALSRSSAPLPPPAAAIPALPEEEAPYCEVCQVFGHDLMGCVSLLEQIPPSSQFSCRQSRSTENKVF